ncbi:MAG: hypothetical protein IJZ71_09255 [Treponema sp.]|nr:hypothetical protein [Treponema sp.]MBQ8777657.1 hypothetical protein [Treponema sp.]
MYIAIYFDLGFITNPKNGRVKGLNEVSLDRTYCRKNQEIIEICFCGGNGKRSSGVARGRK